LTDIEEEMWHFMAAYMSYCHLTSDLVFVVDNSCVFNRRG
jgi:hypothetical protein